MFINQQINKYLIYIQREYWEYKLLHITKIICKVTFPGGLNQSMEENDTVRASQSTNGIW